MKDLNFQSLYKLTVFLFFATLLVYILVVGQGVIVPLVISFFIAFLLIPLCSLFERIHFPRVLASITSVLVAIIVLLGLFTLFGSQIQRFSSDLDEVTKRISEMREKLPDSISKQISDYDTQQIYDYVQEHMGTIFSGLTGFFSGFTVVFIVPIYVALILIYRDRLKEFLFRIFNVQNKPENVDASDVDEDTNVKGITQLVPKIRVIIQKYITGMFYVICILFVLYSIALYSIGLEHAMLFAAIAASFNVIPFIGPFIGSALPILFAFITKDSLAYPAAVLGSFVIIQAVEGNFLTPKIVGNNVSLNPLVTLVTLIIGASIWGIVGMILFIPLVAILKEIFNAVDGLQPYSYVLGTDDDGDSGPGFVSRAFEKLKNKFD